ncbi:MAG: hypothetical protein HZA51_09605 [Planctomycetes bacterium]|nr:hypothetical protein [Planctomycetota bacterium]
MIAHFLQAHDQIASSRWAKSEISFTTQGSVVTESNFPEFDDFVFAAVYFRQLTMKKDALLSDAVTRYLRFIACPLRHGWIEIEKGRFKTALDKKSFPMLTSYSVRELFEAFIYGAGLMHKTPKAKDKKRKQFLNLIDHEPREQVVYSLNMSLHMTLNHVGNIAAVIYQDYSDWIAKHNLPRPDIRWHSSLFEVIGSDAKQA